MSPAFFDDFNRADGPLGNGWTYPVSSWSVNVNRARSPSSVYSHALHSVPGLGADQDIEADLTLSASLGMNVGLILRWNDGLQKGYALRWVNTGSGAAAWYISIVDSANGFVDIAGPGAAPAGGQTIHRRFKAVGSRISLLDGETELLGVNDATIADGDTVGLWGRLAGNYIDNFSVSAAITPVFTVTPGFVRAGSIGVTLNLSNNYGFWEPGVPGAPIFYALQGVVGDQEVLTGNTAVIEYTPPDYPVVDSIVDPSSGLSASLTVADAITAELETIKLALGNLPSGEDIASYLRRITGDASLLSEGVSGGTFGQAAASLNWKLFPPELQVDIETTGASLPPLDNSLYAQLKLATAIAANSQATLVDVLTHLLAIRGEGLDTLRAVVNDIRGLGGYDIGDLYEKINALPTEQTVDLSSVLAAIAALRGNDSATVAAVLAAVLALPDVRGPGLWNLTDLYQHVSNAESLLDGKLNAARSDILAVDSHLYGDTQSILAAIRNIQSSGGSDLWDAINAILAGLGLGGGAVNSVWDKINTVLSGVNALADLLKRVPQTTYLPPVWPGASNVMKRESIALNVGLTIPGPVDGVIVEIAAVPAHTPHYDFNGVWSHNHVGALAFRTDEGACEPPQNFGWTKGVYVPKTMVRAGSIVVRCKAGVIGSVTPWVVQPAVS